MGDGVEWRDVVGFEGLYRVSNRGSVLRVARTVTQTDGSTRYLREMIMEPKRYDHVADWAPSYFVLRRRGRVFERSATRLVGDAFPELRHTLSRWSNVRGARHRKQPARACQRPQEPR